MITDRWGRSFFYFSFGCVSDIDFLFFAQAVLTASVGRRFTGVLLQEARPVGVGEARESAAEVICNRLPRRETGRLLRLKWRQGNRL